MKILTAVVMVIAIVMVLPGSVQALDMGQNITIPDLVGSGSTWHGTQEDQEVEPGCQTGQKWDLEGFFLKGSVLSMVGGYDFINGQDGWTSGDIFIDTDGIVKYGPAASGTAYGNNVMVANSDFGYEYVIDLNMDAQTYNVYALGDDSLLAVYQANEEANPWQYIYDQTRSSLQSGSFGYETGLADGDVGLAGGLHNVLSVPLAFLSGADFISHFTMKCGNDNLMGNSRVPDGGVTAMLLGLTMLTVEGIRRKIRK